MTSQVRAVFSEGSMKRFTRALFLVNGSGIWYSVGTRDEYMARCCRYSYILNVAIGSIIIGDTNKVSRNYTEIRLLNSC